MRIPGPRFPCSRGGLRGEIMSTSAADGRRVLRHRAQGGCSFHEVTATRSSPEFADFILEIAEQYPAAETIHLILDNFSTHSRKALVDRFGEEAGGWLWPVHRSLHSQHGSWLNQAEIAISLFSRQCLGKRRIGDMARLRGEAKAWNRRANRDRITIKWKFTRKQARRKMHYSFTRSRY